jgi:hypothetical protein
MKEYKFLKESFIGGWFIPNKICDNIIKFYENNINYAIPGEAGNGIEPEVKTSLDLVISHDFSEKPFLEYRKYLQKVLNQYIKKYEFVNLNHRFNINTSYQIQKYKKNEGFKKWHFENVGGDNIKRILVFMTYLNNVKDGGTNFFYQKITSPAKKGLTLIWPAHWTHTHKGQISKKQEKYIVTGWFTYNK